MRALPILLFSSLASFACNGKGDDSAPPGSDGTDGADGTVDAPAIEWEVWVEGDPTGAWLSAWGPDESAVWVVGGQPEVGAVLHGPLDDLQSLAVPDGTPLLNWAHGTSDTDVWVGGVAGTILHWDGAAWSDHSLDIEEAIWGTYAVSSTEVYAVGGASGFGGEDAVALSWDGSGWTRLDLPAEIGDLSNLFKVHHDGEHLWMVGHQGVALRLDGDTLIAVSTGTTADLVTANRPAAGGPMVVVGGRGTGVVVEPNGDGLAVTAQTQAGLNGVQVYPSGVAVVVGEAGYSALYDLETDTVTPVLPITRDVLHATWGVPGGRMLAVGGNLFTSDDTFVGTLLLAPAPE